MKKVKNKLFFWIGVILLYITAFYPVLRSGYLYDDTFNYAAKGYLIVHDMNIFEMTKNFVEQWFFSTGRCFFFAFYAYFFFVHSNLISYKLCIVLATLVDGILIKRILEKTSGNKRIGSIALFLFPAIVSLDCSWFNAMYGFHMLVQIALMWSLLGMLCFQQYMESDKTVWQVLSCTCLFISLGTYEVSYILCLIYIFLAYDKYKKCTVVIKKLIPHFLIGVFWVGLNIYAQHNASAAYPGTAITLGKEVVWGFLRQLSGTTAVVNVINNLKLIEDIGDLSIHSTLKYYIIVLVIIISVRFILKKNTNEDSFKYGLSLLIATWFIVSPTILIAISSRYQVDVSWGHGYLPALISTWGWAVCMAVAIDWLYTHGMRMFPLLLLLTFIISGISIPNSMIADYTVNAAGNKDHLQDVLFEKVMASGIFNDWDIDENVIDENTVWKEKNIHYSWKLNKRINAVSISELCYYDENHNVVYTDKYDYFFNLNTFWDITVQDSNAMFIGNCEDLNISEENGAIKTDINAKDLYIFVPNNSEYKSLVLEECVGSGNIINADLSELDIYSETSDGVMYMIHSNDGIKMSSVSLF